MSGDRTQEIASDAYVYFYPVVENLKTLFLSSVWPHTSGYRGAPNVFHHATNLVDYTFTGVVSPNNDTLYSSAWLDLDEQPLILGLPDVTVVSSGKRYYSMQVVDGYTFNIKTVSPRTTGSWKAEEYAIAGPNYKGTLPDRFDVDHVIRSSSRFTFVLIRTGVNGKDDVPNVIEIQKGYTITPIDSIDGSMRTSSEQRTSNLPPFPFIDIAELASNSPEPQLFFTYANFIMQFIRIKPYESDLFQRFRQLNIGPGFNFNGQSMRKLQYAAIKIGIASGSEKIEMAPLLEHFGNLGNGWSTAVDPPVFGPEEVMKERYLTRAFAARVGLYGADPGEAYYPSASKDSVDSDPLDGIKYKYTLTFQPDQFPPLKDSGFWSVTLYALPQRLLVHNPIDRYSIGDRTPGLVFKDGTLTLYIQKDQPVSSDQVANWLPTPDPNFDARYSSGLFNLIFRIYWPTDKALSDPYFPPPVIKASSVIKSVL